MRYLVLMALFSLLVTGCGYHTPGQGSEWVGEAGNSLYIELFANRSKEPYLENFVTDEVTLEFSRSRLVELTEERSAADLLLSGTVVDFDTRASSYDSADQISEYRVLMKIRARLVRRETGEVLWVGNLRRKEYFTATVNKNLQQDIQTVAARVIARRLAEDLYARMLADF